MTNVGKIVMIITLILIGLFIVYVINNNVTKKKSATLETTLSFPLISPSITQAQIANLTPSKIPSISTQIEVTTIIIKTSKGDIELTLYPKDAPNTVNNFLQKAKSGFYNDLSFHRVEDWVVQGGDPLGNGTGGGNMKTELNNKPFIVGSLGVARGQDIKVSNDAQFFITKTEAPWLNGQYTNFGIVKEGMDVVNKIEIGSKILGITLR